jgi:ABC-type iron transport system FetAB permease component
MPFATNPEPEQLIVITGLVPDEVLDSLRERYRVTQSVSKRVFLVRGQLDLGWSAPEGVRTFSTADIPEEILNSLDQQEAMFVAAWRLRLQAPTKQRPGEGLDWDAPGFEPPR